MASPLTERPFKITDIAKLRETEGSAGVQNFIADISKDKESLQKFLAAQGHVTELSDADFEVAKGQLIASYMNGMTQQADIMKEMEREMTRLKKQRTTTATKKTVSQAGKIPAQTKRFFQKEDPETYALIKKIEQLGAEFDESMADHEAEQKEIDLAYEITMSKFLDQKPVKELQKIVPGAKLKACDNKCGKTKLKNELYKCARCRETLYCSPECQKAHWKASHKVECKKVEEVD